MLNRLKMSFGANLLELNPESGMKWLFACEISFWSRCQWETCLLSLSLSVSLFFFCTYLCPTIWIWHNLNWNFSFSFRHTGLSRCINLFGYFLNKASWKKWKKKQQQRKKPQRITSSMTQFPYERATLSQLWVKYSTIFSRKSRRESEREKSEPKVTCHAGALFNSCSNF